MLGGKNTKRLPPNAEVLFRFCDGDVAFLIDRYLHNYSSFRKVVRVIAQISKKVNRGNASEAFQLTIIMNRYQSARHNFTKSSKTVVISK